MKITEIFITVIKWSVRSWDVPNISSGGDIPMGIVTVRTDADIDGYSFLGDTTQGADVLGPPIIYEIRPRITGMNPLDRGAIWTKMYGQKRNVSMRAMAAIDVALWDIAGKAMEMPVHQIIGTCKRELPAYGSSTWLPRADLYAADAKALKNKGWQGYKIHPHGDWKTDIEICRAVREAVGDDFALMFDATWSYDYTEALRVGRALDELGFVWYEDPLAEESLHNYVDLCRKLDTPVMSTEHAPGGYHGVPAWIEARATDIVRGGVATCGGITPLIRLAHLADAYHKKCQIHHGGNSLNNVANLHAAMAIPNCDYFEVSPANGWAKHGLVDDIEVDENGLVHAPTRPGLGFDIDWFALKIKTMEVLGG